MTVLSVRPHCGAPTLVVDGAPADAVLLSDLLEGRAREYKLYLFLYPPCLTDGERRHLKGLLRRDGKVALWVYAPGFVGDDLSVEHCHDLTGIRPRVTARQWGARVPERL